MFSLRVMRRSSTSSWWAATAPSPSLTTAMASFSSRAVNSGDLATKSVSELSSTMAAVWPCRATVTAPCSLARSARSAALLRPFSRSQVIAFSMSPSFSVRARLASIIPTPVDLRRAWTSLALKSAISGVPGNDRGGVVGLGRSLRRAAGRRGGGRGRRRLRWRVGRAGARVGTAGLGAPGRHGRQPRLALLGLERGLAAGLGLLLAPAGLGLRVELRRGRRRRPGAGGGRRLGVATGGDELALLDRVGDHPAHQRAGPDGVVVAGDHVLDQVGVA